MLLRRRALLASAVSVPAFVLAGCGGDQPAGTAANGAGDTDDTSDSGGTRFAAAELTVFAAASLRTVMDQVGESFTAAHPDRTVRFSFAGSSDLVAQLDAGAPADVLITADQNTMRRAQENGSIAGEPEVIATNVPVLVTAPGNPHGITTLVDATTADVSLVTCAPQVPCGAAAATVADEAGLTLEPVSEETSVTDVLGKVTSGQADAGIVYATDAISAGDTVHRLDLPGAEKARTEYPAAVTATASAPDVARSFLDFLAGKETQMLLADAGFGAP